MENTTPAIEFALVDIGDNRIYIQRTWKTKADAEFVRKDLLKGFPLDNPWHKRLRVVEHKAIPVRRKRK